MKDKIDCDVYQLEELFKMEQVKRKEDYQLIEQLVQKGYMEDSGYAWAYPRAAELDNLCRNVIEKTKNKKIHFDNL
jgi:hypothetical protein